MRRNGDKLSFSSRGDKAYHVLVDRIVSLDIPPGSALIEADLMRDLGMSRTPIREALQRLSQEGLITHVPRRGVTVAEIRPQDFQQICEFRAGTEGMAARLAAERITSAQLAELLGIQRAMEDSIAAGDARRFVEYDRLFHHLLGEAAQNEFLLQTLVRTYNVHLRLWFYLYQRKGGLRQTGEEHLLLIEALKARDAAAAEQAMRSYLARLHELMRELF
jgi:DNA-binding GntR family transcriptional regulator